MRRQVRNEDASSGGQRGDGSTSQGGDNVKKLADMVNVSCEPPRATQHEWMMWRQLLFE